MYINEVIIKNYRGFRNFKAKLSKLTVIIGENDSGKSNFIEALALPLSSNNLSFNKKRLGISDINTSSIKEFFDSIASNEDEAIQLSKIPKVSVYIQFIDPQNSYETQIVSKWLYEKDGEQGFAIRYDFKPKNDLYFLENVKQLLLDLPKEKIKWFTLPIEYYEYQIVSSNNERQISFNDLKNVLINTINAERDDFSESKNVKSNSILTNLLINTLDNNEQKKINTAYIDFFTSIESTDAFKKLMRIDNSFENLTDYIKELKCTPNFPNLKSILSNITLAYGDEFLYQKGLGKRNIIYLFLLFAHYKASQSYFNLCCIEEPEAHLSVNNLRLAIDFITKSTKNSSSLFQTIISTHNPRVINKLEICNVLAFSGDKAISITDVDKELSNYFRKRPNFDILKLLFADKVILVEGPSEEMLINTWLSKKEALNNIETISIGQKGFKTFLDIWLNLNKNNENKKIGIVRDFDNQPQAKSEHDKYDRENDNVTIRTTTGYTLEDDLVSKSNNCKLLSGIFNITTSIDEVSTFLKNQKTDGMLKICDYLDKNKLKAFELPDHITQVLESLS